MRVPSPTATDKSIVNSSSLNDYELIRVICEHHPGGLPAVTGRQLHRMTHVKLSSKRESAPAFLAEAKSTRRGNYHDRFHPRRRRGDRRRPSTRTAAHHR